MGTLESKCGELSTANWSRGQDIEAWVWKAKTLCAFRCYLHKLLRFFWGGGRFARGLPICFEMGPFGQYLGK